MIGRLWQVWRHRKETRERASLDALKVRYHTFRILLANNERALSQLAKVEASLDADAPTDELIGLVEDLQALTFEMVDGVARLSASGAEAVYARQLRLEEALRTALETVEEAGRAPSCLSLDLPLDAAEVGGKAAGLSLLRRNGFPVPGGFAVTARACRNFLHETGLDNRIRQGLDIHDPSDTTLVTACAAVRRDILAAPLPGWLRQDLDAAMAALAADRPDDTPLMVAARSSALTEDRPEHSFAGQFTSELNVSPQTLAEGFLKVMAGAFTEQAVAYRLQAGLPPAVLDMTVLVQCMVPATAAGVVFTIDPVRPEMERMLVSAVPGLGILAVSGAVPVDIYRISRDDPTDIIHQLARKTKRAVSNPKGGIRREQIPQHEQQGAVLDDAVLARLTRLALAAETLAGTFSDLEYALDANGVLWLLQSRPARIVWGRRRPPAGPKELFRGGMTAAPGRCLGKARQLADEASLAVPVTSPLIALLPEAAPEAARWLPRWQGVVVAGGNPADHLSTVAREAARPMLTRATGALAAVPDGALILLDAGESRVLAAPPAIGDIDELLSPPRQGNLRPQTAALPPGRARVRDLIVPLTLTDSYGPTFSVRECRTLHDVIRFAHETAVLSLFEAGDSLLEEAFSQVRLLRGEGPLEVMVIDLGGGIREEATQRDITPEDVASLPLAALWRGLATPGLRQAPPPGAVTAGMAGRSLLDSRSRRPVGEPNYALAARDYVNVNARVEFHFAMIDAVCGPRPRGNYVRMRFKGGGASNQQRQRRALCLESILKTAGFFVSRQGDLISAALTDAPPKATAEALEVLGRLLGFSRLLDAAMNDDDAPYRAAEAFWDGDYALHALGGEAIGGKPF